MSEKENAPVIAATITGAEQETAAGMSPNSNFNSNTDGHNGQAHWLADILPHGKKNAISGKRLMEITGAKDLRTVSKAVEGARRAGVPICASTSADSPGYFIAASPDELSGYLRSLDHRLKEIRATHACMRDALDVMTGQGRLF